MNSKHISTFALAVLIVANVIFTILVISEYEKNHYYDQTILDELTALLSESDVVIPDGVLPKKRTDMRVYKSSVTPGGYDAAVSALVGETVRSTDGAYLYSGSAGEYSVTDDFRFTYCEFGYDGEAGRSISVSDKKAAEKVLKTVLSFLHIRQIWETAENRQSSKQPEYKVEKLMVYSGSSALGAHIREYVDGYETGNYIDAVVIGDEVKRAEGQIMFILPDRSYKAKNTDVFGVMIKEKRRVEALGTGGEYTVTSIGYAFNLCFDVFGSAYLIPVCSVGYSDGAVSIYDIVSGELISE